jgi:hypothetical protein
MPIDFNRVPPRVKVPPAPQPSMLVWVILLVLMIGAGAALTIMLWPASRPANTLWFGFCMVGYPLLAWVFLLCSWLAYGYSRRNEAIVTNRVSEEVEQSCHALASRPLTMLSHAWCFSASDEENALEGIREGATQLKPKPSHLIADGDIKARWLEIPEMHFDMGNEVEEHRRHQALCSWLLKRLIDRLASQLQVLPSRTKLRVELHARSKLKVSAVETQLRTLLAERAPAVKVDVLSTEPAIPLFRTDAWLDSSGQDTAYLLIAIELCNAISTVLPNGAAEAGVALLIGHPRLSSSEKLSELRMHRPAKGVMDAVARTLRLATRWGQSPIDGPLTVWSYGLTSERANAVSNAAPFGTPVPWIALETSIGDCAGAGPWLAVALAAENAQVSGDPQLVVCDDGENIVALVCRRQI